jgi:CHAT domain-containing protein
VESLWQGAATRPALLAAFKSGKYDVVHYAGHAAFDERQPDAGGILCHGDVPVTGADLAGLGNLPTLMFFNACESARVRGGAANARVAAIPTTVGLAEAFMRGGVATFLGTYWPVGDAAAAAFADAFYRGIRGGGRIGQAVQAGRTAVKESGSKDWADYVFYGDPDFVLKEAVER